ncbi:unnamed protein product, partial [Brachionus calyciflorus]
MLIYRQEWLISIFTVCLFTSYARSISDKNDDKIKIDLKVEFPRNSLLNLVISASSNDLTMCNKSICKETKQTDKLKITSNLTETQPNDLRKNIEETIEEPVTSSILTDMSMDVLNTTSITYIQKFIEFCGFENKDYDSISNENLNNFTNDSIITSEIPLIPESTELFTTTLVPNIEEQFQTNTDEISTSVLYTTIPDTTLLVPETTTLPQDKKQCLENFKQIDDKCIYISNERSSWSHAKSECEKLKSRLVIPDSEDTFEKVILPLTEIINEDFWVNAYFNIQFDDWVHPAVQLENQKNSQIKDLAYEKYSNSQFLFIDPNDNKNLYCNNEKLIKYSSTEEELTNNYLAITWSHSQNRYCLDNFNLESNKLVV